MPVPEFSEKEWKKVRPDSLKDSGIAKAIDRFTKTCKRDPSHLEQAEDFIAYSDATRDFLDAIKTAQSKTKGKESHDAVKDLLEDWKGKLNDFQNELDKTNKIVLETAAFALHNENRRKANQEYHLQTETNVKHGFEKTDKALKDFASAVRDKNLRIASIQYDKALSGVDDIRQALSKKLFKEMQKFFGKKFGVPPKDIQLHPDVSAWQRDVAKYDTMAEKMDLAFSRLENEVFQAEVDPKGGSEEYQRVMKEVRQRYKEIASEIAAKVGQSKNLVRDCEALEKLCSHTGLTSQAIPQLTRIVDKSKELNQAILDLEQSIIDLLEETRNTSSPTRKRAVDAGVTPEDQEAMLEPLMNVAYKNNKANINNFKLARQAIDNGLDLLVERFSFQPAQDEIDRIDKKVYRAKSSLG